MVPSRCSPPGSTQGGIRMPKVRHVLALLLAMPAAAFAQSGRAEIVHATHHDVSPPLREMPPGPRHFGILEAEPVRRIPSSRVLPYDPDPVVQGPRRPTGAAAAALVAPTPSANFEGIGQGFTGPSGTFVVNSAPPDNNGAVGPNHVVETVNTDFAVFSKSGTPLFGPIPLNTLWGGFGGG